MKCLNFGKRGQKSEEQRLIWKVGDIETSPSNIANGAEIKPTTYTEK